MNNFLCQNILFRKRIETFWFRDISNTWRIRIYCFKYYLIKYFHTVVLKSEKKKN